MAHDFKLFPELTNNQMLIYYFESPHKQIVEDFVGEVVKVTDGDTIRVKCDFRDFNFPIRLANIAAPEKDERGGPESQSWLESKILGEKVDVELTQERVEKWGRLLAEISFMGVNLNAASVDNRHSIPWEEKEEKWF